MLIDLFKEMTFFFVATISANEKTHYCQTFLFFFVFLSQTNSNLMILLYLLKQKVAWLIAMKIVNLHIIFLIQKCSRVNFNQYLVTISRCMSLKYDMYHIFLLLFFHSLPRMTLLLETKRHMSHAGFRVFAGDMQIHF